MTTNLTSTNLFLRLHATQFRTQLLRTLGVTAAVGLLCTATAACDTGGKTSDSQASDSEGSGETSETDASTSGSSDTSTTGQETDATSGSDSEGMTDGTTETTDGTTETTDGTTETTDGTTEGGTESTTGGTDTDGTLCDEPPPEYEVAEACFEIPEGLNSCDECDEECVSYNLNAAITGDPDFCWAENLIVMCGPDDGVPQMEGMCCYVGAHQGIWCEGRPYLVEGVARVAPLQARRDWSALQTPDVASLDEVTRRALADAWREDALMEHASIAAFSRFILQMMALGASADLIDGAQQAIDDEIRHARLCFGLGDAYDGTQALGPGELVIDELSDDELTAASIAAATVLEGCVGETLAALMARAARDRATDPQVREVLEQIAEDEMRHAMLAWRFVQWAIDSGTPEVREAVTQAFDAALSTPPAPKTWAEDVDPEQMGNHGRLTVEEQRQVIEAGLAEVIGPCASALLDPTRPHGQAQTAMPFAPGPAH